MLTEASQLDDDGKTSTNFDFKNYLYNISDSYTCLYALVGDNKSS